MLFGASVPPGCYLSSSRRYAGLSVPSAVPLIRHAKRRGTTNLPWLAAIIARKPTKVAAVALANKTARIAWVVLMRGGTYQKPVAVQAA